MELCDGIRDWHGFVGVLYIHQDAEHELLGVGQAGGAPPVFADFLEDRKKNGGENRDDGDDDEQLNQGKALRGTAFGVCSIVIS